MRESFTYFNQGIKLFGDVNGKGLTISNLLSIAVRPFFLMITRLVSGLAQSANFWVVMYRVRKMFSELMEERL